MPRAAVIRRATPRPMKFKESNGNGGHAGGATGSRIVENAKIGRPRHDSAGLDAQWRTRARQVRHNPIRGLSAERLARALDSFDYGDLREAALMWEQMARRDDMIPTVKAKRERAVVRRGWKVLRVDQSDDAKAHAEVLEYFWEHATGVNAFDRNERGGVRLVLQHIMQATTFKYAAQHIVWRPVNGMLTAEFEFVPLSFFENRTGMLRFTRTGTEAEGEELAPNDWLVTVGEGLMFPASIIYYGKRCSLQDWEAFSEKFGMPGVLGKTRAAKGSAEWDSLVDAVGAFMNDWGAVTGSDDTIELVQAQSTGTMLPMAVKVERADRMLAALWRGADLSTLSSQTGADSTGAGLQEDEAHGMAMDDAAMVSEAMQEIDRRVIAWHFGRGVEPMAYTLVPCPERKDLQVRLAAVKELRGMGLEISKDEIREDFGFQTPSDDDELLDEPKPAVVPGAPGAPGAPGNRPDGPDGADEAENAEALGSFLDAANELIARARVEDQAGLRLALVDALNDATPAVALAAIGRRLPEFLGQTAGLEGAWERVLATAAIRGWQK
jgi:phage gp29-like protein